MNKLSITLLSFLVLITGIASVSAQNNPKVYTLSLKQAQELALENNYSAKNAKIDIELAKKKIWETTAMGLPQVNATVAYQHIFKVPEMQFPTQFFSPQQIEGLQSDFTFQDINGLPLYHYSYNAMIALGVPDNLSLDVTVSQLVFSGAYIVGLQASKTYAMLSDQNLEKVQTDLNETIANTYCLVLNLEENNAILKSRIQLLNKNLSDMRAMNNAGYMESTDIDQMDLTVRTLNIAVNTLERQIAAAKDLLKFQVGISFDDDINLTDNLNDIVEGISLEAIVQKQLQLENNTTFKLMNTQVKLSELNLKREKSGYLPSLAAFYRHSEKAKQADFDFTMKDIAGINMSIPIFSSGQRNAMVAERKLELIKAQNMKDMAVEGVKLEFKNAQNDLASAIDKYNNEKYNMDLATRIYDRSVAKQKEGLASSMDLTNAQNQLLNAQTSYFTAVYQLIVAKNKIDKLTNNQ